MESLILLRCVTIHIFSVNDNKPALNLSSVCSCFQLLIGNLFCRSLVNWLLDMEYVSMLTFVLAALCCLLLKNLGMSG